jgi:hypothetical protein
MATPESSPDGFTEEFIINAKKPGEFFVDDVRLLLVIPEHVDGPAMLVGIEIVAHFMPFSPDLPESERPEARPRSNRHQDAADRLSRIWRHQEIFFMPPLPADFVRERVCGRNPNRRTSGIRKSGDFRDTALTPWHGFRCR